MEKNWERFTTTTNIYNGQIIRTFIEGREMQYKIIGLSSIKGFLEVCDYAVDGLVLPLDKQNKHGFAGWFIIERKFEILIEKPSLDKTWPRNLKEAVEILKNEIDDNKKYEILKMSKEDFIYSFFGLGAYIRNKFGLWQGNYDLINNVDSINPDPDNISSIILDALYEELTK